METIYQLWTFAPEIKLKLAIFILLIQMVITMWCYSQMSKARVRAKKSGQITVDMYKAIGDAEPEELRVYTRLVANQFESPVLFYAIVIAGLAVGATSWLTVILGLVYCLFRFQHAREMAGEHSVPKRRKIFIRSFQVLLLMMVDLAVSTLIYI